MTYVPALVPRAPLLQGAVLSRCRGSIINYVDTSCSILPTPLFLLHPNLLFQSLPFRSSATVISKKYKFLRGTDHVPIHNSHHSDGLTPGTFSTHGFLGRHIQLPP